MCGQKSKKKKDNNGERNTGIRAWKIPWGHLLDVWSWESQLNSVNFHFTCKLGTIMFLSLWSESCAVVSNSFWPHGLYSPWTSPGQNTGVGSLSLLQGIFPTQGPNPGLLQCGQILYQLSHKGSPRLLEWVAYPLSSALPNPRIEPGSPALQVGSLPPELSGEPLSHYLCMLSCFSHVWLFATLWTAARQAPLSMWIPGKNTGVCCLALLQGSFPTQGSNLISYVSYTGTRVLCH